MIKNYLLYAIMLTGLLFATFPAKAEEPHLISTHGNWGAYTFTENGKKVCYMASQPKKMEGSSTKAKRGEVYALITNRPAEGSKNVFSYITGYAYKPGSDVTVTIDKQHFTLFTQDDTAWAPDGTTDGKIAAAIRKGSNMVVKGTSSHGTTTTDTFVLKGSGGAYEAISKDCGKK